MSFLNKSNITTPLLTTRLGGILLVQLPMRLTVLEAMPFRESFKSWVNDASVTKIILDFGQTTIIDSSGIGSLSANIKSAKAKNIPLILWSVRPQIKLAFSLVGLDKILNIEPNTETIIPNAIPQSKQRSFIAHPSVRSPLKRAIDIVGAIIGLTIAAVLFIPIAIAIKIDSPGSVFVHQTHCGWMGRQFCIWKFRSTVNNAEAHKSTNANQASGAFSKNDNELCMTRVGHFLRKTGLDELPLFWNVLKGEMSLIGTCPLTPDELEQYDIPNWQRLDIRPGLSGEWQLRERSKTRNLEDPIKLDLHYQENWSLSYDFMLIFRWVETLIMNMGVEMMPIDGKRVL